MMMGSKRKTSILALLLVAAHCACASNENEKGTCIQPVVENGLVTPVTESGAVFVANVTCHADYVRVGKPLIKCVNGIWSSATPVCTKMGSCEVRDLPDVKNARRTLVSPYRGSVVKYKCRNPFHLLGDHVYHCLDHKKWSLREPPVCARKGCDESEMQQIAYGTSAKLLKGAVYQFTCDQGAVLIGSRTVFCDGSKWNDTAPTCISPPGEPSMKVRVDNELVTRSNSVVLRAGQTLDLRCTARGGNPIPSLTFLKNGQSFGPGPKTFQNIHSFVVTPSDHDAEISCSAQNHGDRRADSSAIKLNVLYPPERLVIEGPDELTPNLNARLTCKASASNLPSKLTFKVTSHHSNLLEELVQDGFVVLEEPIEKWVESRGDNENDRGASGWVSSRSLTLTSQLLMRAAQLGDHISFECQVPDPYHERRILISATKFVALLNPSTPAPVELTLKISGPSTIRFNEPAQFRCSANQKDVELQMKLINQEDRNSETSLVTTFMEKGEFLLNPGQIEYGVRKLVVECSGFDAKSDFIIHSHYVEVFYPPGIPDVSGAPEPGTYWVPDTPYVLTCLTKEGNPPATLNWVRGTTILESLAGRQGQDIVTAQITFVPTFQDDGAQLRCEAINEAVIKPVFNLVTVNVEPIVVETTSTSTTSSTTLNPDPLEIDVQVDNQIDREEDEFEEEDNTNSVDKKEEYEEYDDENYYYEYPEFQITQEVLSDPAFMHPELTQSAIFSGKIEVNSNKPEEPIRPLNYDNVFVPHNSDKSPVELDENKWRKNMPKVHENEVYPKDAPYTASSSKSLVSRSIFLVSGLAVFILQRVYIK